MKLSKITTYLLALSVLASLFIIAKGNVFAPTSILYLVWNLCLAWVPYIISSVWIKKDTSLADGIPFFIIWLIFFPNAPYVVTDVIHVILSPNKSLWYDSLVFFLFGWIGLLLGMISLSHIHAWIKKYVSAITSEIIIFAICALSSFGVFIGRVERWNSWDLFLHPLSIFQAFYTTPIYHNSIVFMIAFTIFTYSIYKTVSVLMDNKE